MSGALDVGVARPDSNTPFARFSQHFLGDWQTASVEFVQ